MEFALASTIEQREQAKKAQTASDREVINFLDLRTQELEATIKSLEEENSAMHSMQGGAKSEVRALQDMLEAEKSKREDGEKQHKMEKRLLIKEVKTLRLQIKQNAALIIC